MRSRGVAGWMRRVYDRLVASIILVALACALILLALHARLLQGKQAEFDRWLLDLKPKHERAQPADRSAYERTLMTLEDPVQIGDWDVRLMIPEMRIKCPNCRRPISVETVICPFCKNERNKQEEDSAWDREFGDLFRTDPNGDPDNDGFTTAEEREAKTNPKNGDSHPSYLTKLEVTDIKAVPFKLVFKAVSVIEDQLLFQINSLSNDQTWWRKLGEEAGDGAEKFKLVAYDAKALGGPELTLRKDDKLIRLKKGQPQEEPAYSVSLHFSVDGSNRVVRTGLEFDLKGLPFRVKSIDMQGRRILITDVSMGKDLWVGRPAPEKKAVVEP